MKIGITGEREDPSGMGNYLGWLLKFNPGIEFINLRGQKSGGPAVEACDGIFLTGGGDVHPRAYGAEMVPEIRDVDERRDEIEFEVIERTLSLSVPLLGICRGLQVTNAFLGGSLYADLETAGFKLHCRADGKDVHHEVRVAPESKLAAFSGVDRGEVNSSHHQGVKQVGRGLSVSARSGDGVVEALEWSENEGKGYLLLVQWHPERMKQSSNPLAECVARTFLEETRKYGIQKHDRVIHQH